MVQIFKTNIIYSASLHELRIFKDSHLIVKDGIVKF